MPDALDDAEHESVLFAEEELSETLAGLSEHARTPVLPPDTDTVKETVPEKPLRLPRVSVDVPVLPVVTVTDAGLAAMAKSGALATVKATIAA